MSILKINILSSLICDFEFHTFVPIVDLHMLVVVVLVSVGVGDMVESQWQVERDGVQNCREGVHDHSS